MDLQYFPHFMGAIFPEVTDLTPEEITDMGKDFKAYLEFTFQGKQDALEAIWCIDLWKVIADSRNPLRTKGYHPALIAHFVQYVKLSTDGQSPKK